MLVVDQIRYKGQITERSNARYDLAILGNWPHTIGSMKLEKGPKTYVGKVAHLLRVYKTCHDTPYSREWNYNRRGKGTIVKVLTTRED